MSSIVKSPTGICRVISIALGVIILVLGLYSHYNSTWIKTEAVFERIGTMKPYELCEVEFLEEMPTGTCPKLWLEQYFVGVAIATFVLSVVSLLTFLNRNTTGGTWKYIDLGYHIVAGILLMVAAVFYYVSAEQIHALFEPAYLTGKWQFLRSEKIAASFLTVIQSLTYGATALILLTK